MTTRRWLRFTAVGLAGFALQLTTVWLLARLTPLPASLIVALAVLLTLSHNFFWHERVTWPRQTRVGRRRRWLAFHAANGMISLATNVVATGPIMQMTGLPIQAASAIAVVAASFANFVAGDRVVFTAKLSTSNLDATASALRQECREGGGILRAARRHLDAVQTPPCRRTRYFAVMMK
jgi:putative flippase GtrA